jgi:copper chaperone CopZ
VSIHCEGCKKKVRKVLHSIEGVYKVTGDTAQNRVVVTGSVGADALVRRLNKAGKQAALWPAPATEAKKKPEEAAPPAADDVCNKDAVGADKADAKPKDKQASNKKPEKENVGSEKKQEKAVEAPKDDGKKQDSEAKEKKGSSEPAKEAAAEEEASGAEEGSAKKKKNKHKDGGGGGEAAPAAEKKQQPPPQPAPAHAALPHGGVFPYYAAQPVMSYNVAPPSASVSYHYAPPTAAVPLQPMPPYGYPPHMMPEYMYGPPGMRASPPHESCNMFNEESATSCSIM